MVENPNTPTLAAALVQLKDFSDTLRAAALVFAAVEACGDVADVVAQLEQERDGLERQVAALRALRSEHHTEGDSR